MLTVSSGKAYNIINEMKSRGIRILGVSEYIILIVIIVIYYFGNKDHKHCNKVSIILDENTNKLVMNFVLVRL